jgi:DNA-binding helix-hairpin-helix protein with protein kinase domain
MPIERAIQEFRFPYGAGRATIQMDPPPNTPGLSSLPQELAGLFERAFSRQAAEKVTRPNAREWLSGLEDLENQLTRCTLNTSHFYYSRLSGCPWCLIEDASGVLLFNVQYTSQSGTLQAFDIAVVWQKISQVSPPAPLGPEPQESDFPAIQARNIIKSKSALRKIAKFVAAATTLIVISILAILMPAAAAFWIIGGLCSCMAIVIYKTKKMGELTAIYKTARSRVEAALKNFRSANIEEPFSRKLQELQKAQGEWQALAVERQRRYAQLESDRQQQQLQRHLEKWRIQHASIKGVGPSKKAMLRSYNIETAWDVTAANVMRVPGFGPKNTTNLLSWRKNAERLFSFDRTKAVDPQAVASLDRDIGVRRRKVELALINGEKELSRIGQQSALRSKVLRSQLEEAYRNMLQAKADLRAA